MNFLKGLRYQYINSRIVHINVNIVLAGFFSMLIAAPIIHLTTLYFHGDRTIALFSFLVDALLDFSAFSILHTFVSKKASPNHKLKRRHLFKDIAEIQGHRIVLSVVFAILAVGGHLFLMSKGLERTHAFFISYGIAIILVRIIHTWYGIKSGLFD